MSECKYVNEKGICEIANIPCEDVLLCSEDGVYTDSKMIKKNKEDNLDEIFNSSKQSRI